MLVPYALYVLRTCVKRLLRAAPVGRRSGFACTKAIPYGRVSAHSGAVSHAFLATDAVAASDDIPLERLTEGVGVLVDKGAVWIADDSSKSEAPLVGADGITFVAPHEPNP